MKPPIPYYGAKMTIAPQIVNLFPDHDHYVEPYAGSLAVLLAKTPSHMETVNDLDNRLMTFWRILRDRPHDLTRACALTPHSRAEYQDAQDALLGTSPVPDGHPDPDLELARRVWLVLTQGRSGTLRRTGWRFAIDPTARMPIPASLKTFVNRIAPTAERLARVSLECRPALDVIADYGTNPRTLLYVDPPYVGTTRAQNYGHEMTADDDHRALAAALEACHATVILSGYHSDLYDDLYRDWHRHEINTTTEQGGKRSPRTEVLWSNRPFRTTTDGLFPTEALA